MQAKTRKAVVAHKIIEAGESLLNLVWCRADARRATSLEIILRTAMSLRRVHAMTWIPLVSIAKVDSGNT